MNYFNKLPTITYMGQLAKNVLARSKLSDETKANNLAFQKYTTEEFDRVDNLANDYYNSPGYSWLVWFSNDTIDPYYGFSLSEFDFQEYIRSKYGSVEKALRTIAGFRIKWENLNPELSPLQYSQAGTLKKYYQPVLNSDLQPYKYITANFPTKLATNVIVQVSFTSTEGTFIVGEEVRQNPLVYGSVVSVTNDFVIVKNIVELGAVFTPGAVLFGVDSGATGTVETVTELSRAIPSDEIPFWESYSFFDYEQELNEQKRNIRLLDARYRNAAESELKRTMRDR
jgi:hypothetical protein